MPLAPNRRLPSAFCLPSKLCCLSPADQSFFDGLTDIFFRRVPSEFAVNIITDFTIWYFYDFSVWFRIHCFSLLFSVLSNAPRKGAFHLRFICVHLRILVAFIRVHFCRQISQTRCDSSGTMSFSMASCTAPDDPGMQKIMVSLYTPATARESMAPEPMSSQERKRNTSPNPSRRLSRRLVTAS